MEKYLILLCLAVLFSCLFLSCAGSAVQEADTDLINEGADTRTEVKYSPVQAELSDYFLSEGDKIAVLTPSSRPAKEQIEDTLNGLKEWGLVPVEGKHIRDSVCTSDDILEDFLWALEDDEISAIFCVRGGYGASEIMDMIPLEAIESACKPIIGYSDISAFHSAWTSAGLPSVLGCMSATFSSLSKECAEVEKNLIFGILPEYRCEADSYCKQGEAEGIIVGGNLATFCSVLGTEYDSTAACGNYILFLEDIGENMQHIHRYLTILKHLGILDKASGIIFGEWTEFPGNRGDYSGSTRGGDFTSVADMISRQFLDDLEIPVAFGFPCGHADVNYPLLLGVPAKLKVEENSFTLSF